MSGTQTVLVTGASGFTGPYMAEALKVRGLSVIGAGQSGQPKDHVFDHWVEVDLTERSEVGRVVADIQPDYVVHLAGISFVGHADLAAFYRVNVLGTENLLISLDESSERLRGVLIASSANVYGSPAGVDYIDESQPPGPMNHYAISKLAMEFAAKKFMSQLPIIIARPFNYIGYGQDKSFVVPKIVSAFAAESRSIELGSLDVSRDFTSVRDTAEAYSRLLTESNSMGEVVNVCSSVAYSLSEIIQMVSDEAGYEIDVVTNPAFVRKHEIKMLRGSNKKLMELTGWKPKVTIKQVIQEMYARYRSELTATSSS